MENTNQIYLALHKTGYVVTTRAPVMVEHMQQVLIVPIMSMKFALSVILIISYLVESVKLVSPDLNHLQQGNLQ